MNTLKENIYDLVGFNNYEQKQKLKSIVYNTFIELLNECMNRNDENIIIEYPFNKDWKNKLKKLIDNNSYYQKLLKK